MKVKSLLKKLGLVATVAAVAVTSVFGLTACNNGKPEMAVNVLQEADSENYGLAVAKSNTEMLAKLNAFIAKPETQANIEKSVNFHTGVSTESIVYPNLEDNTGEIVTMCTEAGFAPYEYQKNSGVGSYKGIAGLDVDLMILFCEENNYKLDVSNGTFDGSLLKVQNDTTGLLVAAAGITIKPDRQEVMGMTEPYIKNVKQAIISLKENDYKTKADLKGKKVGCQLGTSGNFTLDDWNDAEKGYVEAVTVEQVMAAFKDLQNGKLDAVIIDDTVAKNLIANYNA